MDDQTRVLLHGVLGFLDQQQKILTQDLVVSMALRKTMKELNPDFEECYARHFQAEMRSEGKKALDDYGQVLAGLVQQLRTGSGSEN